MYNFGIFSDISEAIGPTISKGADAIDKYTPIVTDYVREHPLVVPAALGILLMIDHKKKSDKR
jgi:hypothetical protein